jgi:hypothetical protein
MSSRIFFPDEILLSKDLTDNQKNVLLYLYANKHTQTHICSKTQIEISVALKISQPLLKQKLLTTNLLKYVEIIKESNSKVGKPSNCYKLKLIPNKINKIKFKIIDKDFYTKWCKQPKVVINYIKFMHIFGFSKLVEDEEIYKIGNWKPLEYENIIKLFKEKELIARKQLVELKFTWDTTEDIIEIVKPLEIVKPKFSVDMQKYNKLIEVYNKKTSNNIQITQNLVDKFITLENSTNFDNLKQTVKYLAYTQKPLNFIVNTTKFEVESYFNNTQTEGYIEHKKKIQEFAKTELYDDLIRMKPNKLKKWKTYNNTEKANILEMLLTGDFDCKPSEFVWYIGFDLTKEVLDYVLENENTKQSMSIFKTINSINLKNDYEKFKDNLK